MALWAALARERPEVDSYRSDLADALGRLGRQYQAQGRMSESEASFRAALDIAERLAREPPRWTRTRSRWRRSS